MAGPMPEDDPMLSANSMIVEDPAVMRGAPVFRGTRVPISNVLASLKAGFELSELREAYPFLTPELVEAAQSYEPLTVPGSANRRSSSVRVLISSEHVPLRLGRT